jgi:hypothetical protein
MLELEEITAVWVRRELKIRRKEDEKCGCPQ